MKKRIQFTGFLKGVVFCLLFLIGNFVPVSGRATGTHSHRKAKTRIKIEYVKKSDNTKQIKATLSARVKRHRMAVSQAVLSLFDKTDSSKLISKAVTGKKGSAVFTLPVNYPIGKDGTAALFEVQFSGNNHFQAATKMFSIKDVLLKANYKAVDSVYTVEISAYELVNGKPVAPVSDQDVYVYVKRLFSLLKVGEGWLNNGKASVEIPNDIPGDYLNHNLELVTMIPESDEYGTVETIKTINWGATIPSYPKYDSVDKRALWEPRAPLWMVITLLILTLGVYSHYLLIAFKLYKIKKLGEKYHRGQ